nr:transposase [Marinisporobacter balticus]
MNDIIDNNYFKNYTHYGEFMYQAKSWNKARRVVVKIERKEGQLVYNKSILGNIQSNRKDTFVRRNEIDL